MLDEMMETLGRYIPAALAAIGILIAGWILALLVRAGVAKLLAMLKINERVKSRHDKKVDVETGVARAVYYVLMLFVLIGVLNVLNLTLVSDPVQALVTPFFAFVPKLVAAGVIALVAWLVATLARTVSTRLLSATKLDQKVPTKEESAPVTENIGNIVYWLALLLFLPAVLATLEIGGLLSPVEAMISDILGVLPNIAAAVVIGVVGWYVAKILRDIVTGLLSSAGADKVGAKVGLDDKTTLSGLAGLLVHVFVFVPSLIAALDALQINAISVPATGLLERLIDAIPGLLTAAAILAVAFIVGRFVVDVVANLLEKLGFDKLPEKLGMSDALSEDVKPSQVVAKIAYLFIILFALVEAANQIEFAQMSSLTAMFIEFGAQVLLGVAILVIGFWLANMAHRAVAKVGTSGDSGLLANLVRYAIFGLVLAMGLRAMGIADDIVNLAFGLTLGAIAVAVALSFGLGGRAAAGKQMEHWLSRLRKGDSGPPK